MSLADRLAALLGDDVDDPDAETFLLYARPLPARDLGFVDPRAPALDVSLRGRGYTIHQSPAVLTSTRPGGTTGAVLWSVSPLFAAWLAAPDNPLVPLLGPRPALVELGCGVSPLCALALGPRVSSYLLTDQPYVQRLVSRNLAADPPPPEPPSRRPRRARARARARALHGPAQHHHHQAPPAATGHVSFAPLDWETDRVTPALAHPHGRSFDAVLACDCVFNYALVAPFVQTCADVCALRRADVAPSSPDDGGGHDGDARPRPPTAPQPCLCLVAQQLRSDDVFLSWLTAFHRAFRVWRLPDEALPEGLRPADGFVVHVGILRDPSDPSDRHHRVP